MPQTGAVGSRQSDRRRPAQPARGPARPEPDPVVAFDPVGEIAVTDRRRSAAGRAAAHAAAAEEFAARFGLDHGVSPVEITGRRTVTILGRGGEGYLAPRVRDDRPRARNDRPRPRAARGHVDRAALWAVALGLLLAVAAAVSAHAATLASLH